MPETNPTEQPTTNQSVKRDALLEQIRSVIDKSKDPSEATKSLKNEFLEIERAIKGLQILLGGSDDALKRILGTTESFSRIARSLISDLGEAKALLSSLMNIESQINVLQKQNNISRLEALKYMRDQFQNLSAQKKMLDDLNSASQKFMVLLQNWEVKSKLNITKDIKDELERSKRLIQAWSQSEGIVVPQVLLQSKSLEDFSKVLDQWLASKKLTLQIAPGLDLERINTLLDEQIKKTEKLEKMHGQATLGSWAYEKKEGITERLKSLSEKSVLGNIASNVISSVMGNVRPEATLYERGIAAVALQVKNRIKQKEELTSPSLPEFGSEGLSLLGESAAIQLRIRRSEEEKATKQQERILQSGKSSKFTTFAEAVASGGSSSITGMLKPTLAESNVPRVSEMFRTAPAESKAAQKQAEKLEELAITSRKSLFVNQDQLSYSEDSSEVLESINKTQEEQLDVTKFQVESGPKTPTLGETLGITASGAISGIASAGYGAVAGSLGMAGKYMENGVQNILNSMKSGITTLASVVVSENAGKITGTMLDTLIKTILIGVERNRQEQVTARAFATASGAGLDFKSYAGMVSGIEGKTGGWVLREEIQKYAEHVSGLGIKGRNQELQAEVTRYIHLAKGLGEAASNAFDKIYKGLGNTNAAFKTVVTVSTGFKNILKDTITTSQSLLQTIANMSEVTRMYNIDVRVVANSLATLQKNAGTMGALGVDVSSVETQTKIMNDFYDRSKQTLAMLAYLGTQGGQAGISAAEGISRSLLGSKIAESFTINLENTKTNAILQIPKEVIGGEGNMFKGLETVTAQQDVITKRNLLIQSMQGKSKDEALAAALMTGQQVLGMSREGILALLSVSEDQLKDSSVMSKLQEKILPADQQIAANTYKVAGLAEANQKIQTAMLNLVAGIAVQMVALPVLIAGGFNAVTSWFGSERRELGKKQIDESLKVMEKGASLIGDSLTQTKSAIQAVGSKAIGGLGKGAELTQAGISLWNIGSKSPSKKHTGATNVGLNEGVIAQVSEYILPSLKSDEMFMLGKGSVDILTPSQVSKKEIAYPDLTSVVKPTPPPQVNIETKPQVVINITTNTMNKQVIFDAIREKLSKELP